MAGDRRKTSWEKDSFEDISSHSRSSARRTETRTSRSSGSRTRSGASSREDWNVWNGESWNSPDWSRTETTRSRDRSSSRGNTQRGRSNRRPATVQRKRQKKGLSDGARRVLVGLTVLVMASATVLLAVFLLFKVSEIQITGDVVESYTDEEVLRICGYHVGDNLFFLSTRAGEKSIKEKLPYIEEAKITRRLPGTLKISLTAARVTACVSQGNEWMYMSGGGKVLERRETPQDGVLRVISLPCPQLKPGQTLEKPEEDAKAETARLEKELHELQKSRSALDREKDEKEIKKERDMLDKQIAETEQKLAAAQKDYNALQAYRIIVGKLTELEALDDFTWLDLTDPSNILLLYRNRIEFKLGTIVKLDYKVQFGWSKAVPGLSLDDVGVLDLSYADENSTAYFTPGELSFGQDLPGAEELPAPEPEPETEPTPSPRGDDIPGAPLGTEDQNGGGDDAGDDYSDYTDYTDDYGDYDYGDYDGYDDDYSDYAYDDGTDWDGTGPDEWGAE